MHDNDGNIVLDITDISLTWAQLKAGLGLDANGEGDNLVSYPFLVSLVNGNTTITGDQFDNDGLEVGAGGTARVNSFAGDDSLNLWHAKTLIWNGGAGIDSLAFTPEIGSTPTPPKGAVVNLTTGAGSNPFGGNLTLSGVENVSGTSKADVLRGNATANALGGGGGADRIFGEGGDDQLSFDHKFTGTAPRVTIDGGAGVDTLLAPTDGHEAINRLDVLAQNLNTGIFRGGQFTSIERFILSSGIATNAVDFRGSDANEFIRTGSGADTVGGRGGNDTVMGLGGGDKLDGGAGIDTLDYSIYEALDGIVVNLQANTASGGDAQGDTILNFENIIGANRTDRLTGSAGANRIETNNGNDTVLGGGGNDLIIDTNGRCLLDGGTGNDVIRSSDFFEDRVKGGTGNDSIFASGAADTIDGGAGNDRLLGGLGLDRLRGGDGIDRFVFSDDVHSGATRGTADIILDFDRTQDLIDVSGIDARASAGGNQAFVLRSAITGEGQIRVVHDAVNTYVELNIFGTTVADMIIRINGHVSLAADDFVL